MAALFITIFALPAQAQNLYENEPTTTYDLKIANTDVTSDNCNDLSKIPGVSGTVSYNPQTKTLTLQDATIDIQEDNAILSYIDDLTVKVTGTNNLSSSKATISFRAPLTITGGGTLNLQSEKDCALYINATKLTIDNCTLSAKSKVYGISGAEGIREKVAVTNATVIAEGTKYGSICDIAELTLTGCSITEPMGAIFDPDKRAVVLMLNNEIVKSKVIISKDPTGIEAPVADTAAPQGIFTLSGVRLPDDAQLSKGIYIVNGKKVVKQ